MACPLDLSAARMSTRVPSFPNMKPGTGLALTSISSAKPLASAIWRTASRNSEASLPVKLTTAARQFARHSGPHRCASNTTPIRNDLPLSLALPLAACLCAGLRLSGLQPALVPLVVSRLVSLPITHPILKGTFCLRGLLRQNCAGESWGYGIDGPEFKPDGPCPSIRWRVPSKPRSLSEAAYFPSALQLCASLEPADFFKLRNGFIEHFQGFTRRQSSKRIPFVIIRGRDFQSDHGIFLSYRHEMPLQRDLFPCIMKAPPNTRYITAIGGVSRWVCADGQRSQDNPDALTHWSSLHGRGRIVATGPVSSSIKSG